MRYIKKMGEAYSPLYFLNALGSGGLAVSFYMYLMWFTPHEGSPVPTFASLTKAMNGCLYLQFMVVIGLVGVALFSLLHFRLLFWNLQQLRFWRKTEAYEKLRVSNGETQLMTIPLTLAMTVNVLFIVGGLFVPNLWESREMLFPFALAAFMILGFYSLKIYLDFFARVLTQGGFDCAKNNSLGQMISVFAFSMVGVGFAAVAAMSHEETFFALGIFGTVFFVSGAFILGAIKLVLGFRAMMEHKAEAETTPTLWIIIPILTVLGIALYRLKMSLMHNFHVEIAPAEIALFLVTLFAVQLFFGLLGWAVMNRAGYMKRFVNGNEKSAGAYTLICPGVALFVLGNFVLAWLTKADIIERMSTVHGILYAPLVYLQIVTIILLFKLNKKLLHEKKRK